MAGVKGKSGGARPGAGAKPAEGSIREDECFQTDDPDAFLRAVMADPKMKMADRMAAALALKRAGKSGPVLGKKERQQGEAEAVVRETLSPLPAPRPKLRAVG